MRPFKLSIYFILKLGLSYCLAVLPSANIGATESTLQKPVEILNLLDIYNSIKGHCNDQTSDKLLFVIGNLRSINQSFIYNQRIETTLHLAVKKRCYSSVRYLLENKVDTNIFNESGLTAFDLAVKDGDQTLLSLFINHFSGRELDEPLEVHPKAEVTVKDEITINTNNSTIADSAQQGNEATDQLKKANNTKLTEIEVKVGFLMSKLSEEAQTNLTTELKAKYQLTKTITAAGSAQLFYTRVKNSEGTANTTRYVLEGTLAKKIFGEQWDGNLNLRNEKVDHVNTINISVLISKAWEMFNNKVAVSVAAGPSFIHATSIDKTINTPGILANGTIRIDPSILLPLPKDRFKLEANATYSQGAVAEAHQLSASVSAVYQFNQELSLGVTGKRWNTLGEKGTQYIVEIQYTPKQNLF